MHLEQYSVLLSVSSIRILRNSHALTFVICNPTGEPIQNAAVLSSTQNNTLEMKRTQTQRDRCWDLQSLDYRAPLFLLHRGVKNLLVDPGCRSRIQVCADVPA